MVFGMKRKICIWIIGLMITWSLVFTPNITASISKEFNDHRANQVTIKTIGPTGIKEHKIELSRSQFTELRKLLSDAKNRETRINMLNSILANHSLPPISTKDINVEGKATRIHVYEYFGKFPPLIKLILQLLIGCPGKVLCFGYSERKEPTYHVTFYPSTGWVRIDDGTNLTGRLRGDLGFIAYGSITYATGVEGFTGRIIEINFDEAHQVCEAYFVGHAERVDIESY